MKILLINPPIILPRNLGTPSPYIPLGLAYLAAELEKKDHDVSIQDILLKGWDKNEYFEGDFVYHGLSPKEILEIVRQEKPSVVGITVPYTIQEKGAFIAASAVKEAGQEITTILGGSHPTIRPEDCARHEDVDLVVMGEGEKTFFEIIKQMEIEGVHGAQKINGVAYEEGGKVHINPPSPLIENLDSIPFPARHLLDLEAYFEASKASSGVHGVQVKSLYSPIITSRGCPYDCIFCSIDITMGKKMRMRSPNNVVDELEEMVHRHGIRTVLFEDDNLTHNKKRILEICKQIITRGLDIEWYNPNGIRADKLDKELLSAMKRSGCKLIWVAPESGSQRVVTEIIGKHLKLESVEDTVKTAKKVGIKVGLFFVVGLPGETKAEMQKSLVFAQRMRQLGASCFTFSVATPLYGTRFYKMAMEQKLLDPTFDSNCQSPYLPSPLQKQEWTADYVQHIVEQGRRLNHPQNTKERMLCLLRNPSVVVPYIKKRLGKKSQIT
ncbi:MAG: B12-binding domain-containing radical SAM protein [Thermoplasmata archaeon]|nr:MAG: B12-binding domain-containing radical SAM protein [Thermoplasmata archaeon]